MADGTGCDDGEACTDPDECSGGVCGGPAVLSCDDGNECTDDSAVDDGDGICDDPVADCVHENNTAPCSDDDACTTEDICDEGVCVGGPAPDCDDLNPCTDDSCDTATGCVNAFNTNPCSDPYDCTGGDVCVDGECVGTPNDTLCDDGNVCTTGACLPGTAGTEPDGCLLTPVTDGSPCDDESICTDPDYCEGGICTGSDLDCSDGIACTDDLCDDVEGCQNPGTDFDGDGWDICGPADPVDPDGLEPDCEDGVAGIHPGADEDCFNDLDDDCNDLVDEADPLGCPRSDVSGTVVYYRGPGSTEPSTKPVPGTTMTMVGTASVVRTTNSAGGYEFQDVLKGLVSVIPTKVGDFGSSAISSLDAARVSQFRVAMVVPTEWQLIAADASGNGTISAFDAALISQLRVGIISRLPVANTTGSDWAFLPDQRDYAPLIADMTAEDYVGILYGDVTGNWAPPAGKAGSKVVDGRTGTAARPLPDLFEIAAEGDVSLAGGDDAPACELRLVSTRAPVTRRGKTRYLIYAERADGLLGLDLDIRYSSDKTRILSVSTTERTADFHLVNGDQGGTLRLSMYGDRPLVGDGALLELFIDHRDPRGGRELRVEALVNEGSIPCSVKVGASRRRPDRR